jgi:hypothetical protein
MSTEDDVSAFKMFLALGNVNHHESDLPKDQIDETDLEIMMQVLPIEIIY